MLNPLYQNLLDFAMTELPQRTLNTGIHFSENAQPDVISVQTQNGLLGLVVTFHVVIPDTNKVFHNLSLLVLYQGRTNYKTLLVYSFN